MTRAERKKQLQAAGKWDDFQAIRDELKAEGWAASAAADEAMCRLGVEGTVDAAADDVSPVGDDPEWDDYFDLRAELKSQGLSPRQARHEAVRRIIATRMQEENVSPERAALIWVEMVLSEGHSVCPPPTPGAQKLLDLVEMDSEHEAAFREMLHWSDDDRVTLLPASGRAAEEILEAYEAIRAESTLCA